MIEANLGDSTFCRLEIDTLEVKETKLMLRK